MIVELSQKTRNGEQVRSAILHHHGCRDKATSIVGGSYLHFDQVADDPPEPGTYVIQATLESGFCVWAKMEIR